MRGHSGKWPGLLSPSPARARLFAAAALVAGTLAGCSSRESPGTAENGGPAESWAPAEREVDGLSVLAAASGRRLVLHTAGGDTDFVAGVNLGSTIPGRWPGELAVRAGDYRRWFARMRDLDVRAVRVYTIHPPEFYAELAAHNENNDDPLYLVQGVYLPDESYVQGRDLYAPAVSDAFRAELGDAVRAVHGELRRPGQPGRASGSWNHDVSPWLIGYLIGVEWEPAAVAGSDARNAHQPAHAGRYFSSTEQATPTERWLASMLDLVASEEAQRGRSVPLGFVNWSTTDPLRHPGEPLPEEDLVGIDANHVAASPAWPAGQFAAYHAYPYFPDFLHHERALQRRYRGRIDPYATYLSRLRDHHADMPVVVGEFGVPSSWGAAHRGPLGRDQGDHSEREAMATNAELLRMMRDLDLGGAFVFEWTDEWFKSTWNTAAAQVPAERRALWLDPWTNEQHFGLLAVEPGARPLPAGDRRWDPDKSQAVFEGAGTVRQVRVAHDPAFLYLRVLFDSPAAWERGPVALGFDLVPGGEGGLPGLPGRDPGADRAVTVQGGEARLWQPARVGGDVTGEVPPAGEGWVQPRLLLSRARQTPGGEPEPASLMDVGELKRGTWDPASDRFDSRSGWNGRGSALVLRLPWMALGLSDPSSRTALAVSPSGERSPVHVERLGISVTAGADTAVTAGYSWEPWESVTWHEREKAGLPAVSAALRETMSRG